MSDRKISELATVAEFPANGVIPILDPDEAEPADQNKGYTGLPDALADIVTLEADMEDKLYWVDPPTSTNDSGTAGMIAYDASYLYICTANNTWRRVALAAW